MMPTIEPNKLIEAFRQSRYQDVISSAKTLTPDHIEEPRLAFVIAGSFFALGQYHKALPYLEAFSEDLDADAAFLSLYGATCRRLGKLDMAKRLLKKALALDSTSKEPQNNYANLLIDLGEYSEARKILESLVARYPDYSDAQTNLNRLSYRESLSPDQSHDAAPHLSHQRPSATPVPGPTLDPLVDAFSEKEVKETEQRYNKRQRLSSVLFHKLLGKVSAPTNDQVASDQLKLVTELIREGSPEKALKLCSSILSLQSVPASHCYVCASEAYLRLQRIREAENCLLQSVILGESSFSSFVNLANFAMMRRDYRLAEHYLDRAASIDPSDKILSSLRTELSKQREKSKAKSFRFEEPWHLPSASRTKPALES